MRTLTPIVTPPGALSWTGAWPRPRFRETSDPTRGCLEFALALSLVLVTLAFAEASGGRIVDLSLTTAEVGLLFETAPGCSYQVQTSPTLGSRFWRDAATPACSSGERTCVVVPAEKSTGFHRVLEFTNRVFWYDWEYYYEAPLLTTWGLGVKQDTYVHNDRDYEWYIDQADTGAYAGNNCGPASVTMAIKWYDRNFNRPAQDARNTFPRDGGWWYSDNILDYLKLHIPPRASGLSAFTGTTQLMGLLDQGHLVIVCISTLYLTKAEASEHRVGKFYKYGSGHFLVVKGYRVVDGRVFFEVYDPRSHHAAYADSTPKGRNRHLAAGELATAIVNWWNYLIVIAPSTGPSLHARASRWLYPVDPAQVVHMWGR